MKISNFKVFTIFSILAILGCFCFTKISVKLKPSKTLPSLSISYNWHNASPRLIEKEITSVLENGLSTIRGVKNIASRSSNGEGYINIEFNKYVDMEASRFEVANVIRSLRYKLPKQSSYPLIHLNKPDEDNRAFLVYNIYSSASPIQIQQLVNAKVKPVIGAITNVDQVSVYGANEQEYELSFNPDRLKSLHINRHLLTNQLESYFKKLSLGNVIFDTNTYSQVSIQQTTDSLSWHIPITRFKEKLLYLDDLVTIRKKEKETLHYYRVNGNNAITLAIYPKKNANTIALSKRISKRMNLLKNDLPKNYSIVKTYDTSENLKAELSKMLERTLYTILIMLLLVLIISRDLIFLLIIVLSLIANICIAFIFYFLFDIEIQLYSLAGIAISLGLMIDNSIVMINHLRHGKTINVILPILASTLTTVGALSCIFFLDEKYKLNLIDFAIVIIVNLTVSIFVALLLIPSLTQFFKLKKKDAIVTSDNPRQFTHSYYKVIRLLLKYKKIVITTTVLVFGIPFFMLPDKFESNEKWYERMYNSSLGNTDYVTHVKPILDTYLGGSFRLFSMYVFENTNYNDVQQTKIQVKTHHNKGITVAQVNEAFSALEDYLHPYNDQVLYTTNIQSGNHAILEILFDQKTSASYLPGHLKTLLISKVLEFDGLNWDIEGFGSGFNLSNRANTIDFSYKIEAKGYNYEELNNWITLLQRLLEKNSKVRKVSIKDSKYSAKSPVKEYYFEVDKRLAILKKVPIPTIFNAFKDQVLSKNTDLFIDIAGQSTPVRFQSITSKNFDLWDIKHASLTTNKNSEIINISNLITTSVKERAPHISKKNKEYSILIRCDYTGARKKGSDYLNTILSEFKKTLPLGYSFERSENQFSYPEEERSNYSILLGLIFLIILFIGAILFENLKQPFVILSSIPISFIGVFLSFYLCNFNFDQGGMASFVLLSGLSVNASILIINTFNSLKKESSTNNSITLYIQAFKENFFTILITILSTIFGFIPFIKDGQNEVFWFALGAGTIGGLICSLFGLIFLFPVFFLSSKDLKESHKHTPYT